MTPIDISSTLGLIAVGALTANILLGLLISSGYNPVRRWPRRRIKLFLFHKWTGYGAMAIVLTHPLVLLLSQEPHFRALDVAIPIWSPTQAPENTIGAVGLYLVAFAVATSYFRHAIGFHRWKLFHYSTYAAAAVFYVHGVLEDPLLKNRSVDWLDAEKVYVEGCFLIVAAATAWRVKARRRRPHAAVPRS
jgi:predicted ferric reductase